MTGRALRASPLSIGAVVVVLAISLVAFAVSRHSAEQQEKVQLQNQADQGALVASTFLSDLGALVDPLATGVTLSRGSAAQFEAQAHALSSNGLVLVLAHHEAGQYLVTGVVGKGFSAGQVLTGPVGAAVSHASATITPTPVVHSGESSTAGFAFGPPLVPSGYAIYTQIAVNPFTATPATTGRPFRDLRVALYGSNHPAPGNLFVATTRQLPLTGPVARAPVQVGAATWTLLAEAKAPLNGSFASNAPLIILLLGILVAVVLGIGVEILARRQRYAATLVAQRTADLEHSLAELHEAQDALVRSERLSALGEMASVVGHELRNPLTAVTNALFLIRRDVEPASEALEQHLAMAERETDKAATLASDLTAFVRPRDPVLEPVELGEVVQEVMASTPPPDAVRVDLSVTEQVIQADRHQMAEVVTNLVTNAYQALPDGGSVHVGVQANGSGVALVVQDDGPGIGQAASARLFEPFFTTKPSGTGLGLAIVRRLVEAHGGTISVRNVEPHGARVEVLLPPGAPTGNGA